MRRLKRAAKVPKSVSGYPKNCRPYNRIQQAALERRAGELVIVHPMNEAPADKHPANEPQDEHPTNES